MTLQITNSANVSDDHGIWQIRWMIAVLNKGMKRWIGCTLFYMWRDMMLLEVGID